MAGQLLMTEFQLSLSTAEDEANYFSQYPSVFPAPVSEVPTGIYRVIDGQLFQVVPGVPISLGLPSQSQGGESSEP